MTHLRQCSFSTPPEKVRKPRVFEHFQMWEHKIGVRFVKHLMRMENKQNDRGDTLNIKPKMFVSMTAINNSKERPVIKFCSKNDVTALSSTDFELT